MIHRNVQQVLLSHILMMNLALFSKLPYSNNIIYPYEFVSVNSKLNHTQEF